MRTPFIYMYGNLNCKRCTRHLHPDNSIARQIATLQHRMPKFDIVIASTSRRSGVRVGRLAERLTGSSVRTNRVKRGRLAIEAERFAPW